MADNYTVADNEWLLKIANDNDFHTTDAIVAANPDLQQSCASNYYVLAPGTCLNIPDLAQKDVSAATNTRHEFQVRQAVEDLVITVQAADGTVIRDGTWEIVPSGSSQSQGGSFAGDVIRFPQWPSGVAEADLKLRFVYQVKLPPGVPDSPEGYVVSESVRLKIGGLDPLTGSAEGRSRAVQKILTNLNLYGGPIDGDLTTDRSRAAIHKFRANLRIKTSTDLLNTETVNALLNEQKSQIGNSQDTFQAQTKDRDIPLALGAEAHQTDRRFESLSFDSYRDTVDTVQRGPEHTIAHLVRFFPETAYVALSDTGSSQNPNVIRMKSRKLIFVDSGRWCKAGRDFSVIYGRHVYLCEFVRDPGSSAAASPPPGDQQRLDWIFFKEMGANVKVNFQASAQWALESEFDWTQLVVIIPDLHLMNIENGQIFRGKTFKLDPELDLLLFAKRLQAIAAQIPGLRIVQLGDAFDLWVGCEPRLFQETDDLLVELCTPPDQRWSCGSVVCEGQHHRPDVECPEGIWKCRNFYCRGHDKKRSEPCHEIVKWNCGRSIPPCSGHDNATGVCETWKGYQWNCAKTQPPCPGHDGPPLYHFGRWLQKCPETVDALPQIVAWINDIRGIHGDWVGQALKMRGSVPAGIDQDADLALDGGGYLNPACAALDLLEKKFDLTYLHGNHDNYLIRVQVTQAAGITKRHRWFETDGVLIEHGHRLEARLVLSGDPVVPTNYDGSSTGYKATLEQYHDQDRRIRAERLETDWSDKPGQWWTRNWLEGKEDFADWAAQQFQQTQYMTEFAKIWVGRHSLKNYPAPHIFGIGHTHDPLLQYVNIFLM